VSARVRERSSDGPTQRALHVGARLWAAAWLLSSACTGDVVALPGTAHNVPSAIDPVSPREPRSPTEPATPGMTDTKALTCRDLGNEGAPVPLRRLTRSQVQRIVTDALGVQESLPVSDERLHTFRSNVSTSIDTTGARGYFDFAERVAARVDLSRCGAGGCLSWLLDDVGLRLFRRPLTPEQRTSYRMLFEAGGSDGARWVLAAMVQSPSFLYLDEGTRSDGYLDDYALAARMALVLWGSAPDLTLLQRAAREGLTTPADVRDEAERMLRDPRSEGGFSDFVEPWLELHKLDDPDARPDLSALGRDVLVALRREPIQMFAALVAHEGGLRELLTTTQTVRSDALASMYGRDVVSTSDAAFMLDAKRRAGILTLPGVMAALSHAGASSPTLRGYTVLSHLLCAPPPPPPAGVKVTLPEVGPNASARERLEAHFSDASCGSCHRTMDGIGFAFESIDWLGRSRDDDRGRPIDDRSTFRLSGEEQTIDGVVELARALAESEAVADCVGRMWARYATGVEETQAGECLVQKLGEELTKRDGLKQMMLIYLGSDWFRRARRGV
jgi:hypothetical protein